MNMQLARTFTTLAVGTACFLPLIAAEPVNVQVTTDRIAYDPGASVRIEVTVSGNPGGAATTGTLIVAVAHDLGVRHALTERALDVSPNAPQTVAIEWQSPAMELWGCEATAVFTPQTGPTQTARRVFVVSSNLPKVSANYAFTHPMALGRPTEVNLNRAFDCFARYAIPMVELFSWAPSPWGDINPEADMWINGQCKFIMERATIEGVITHAHRRGMKAMAYAITWLNGPAGYRWAREHPEDVRYTTADAKLPPLSDAALKAWEDAEARVTTVTHAELRDLERWGAAVNASRDATVDRSIDEYIKVIKRFGFDGIRWDGHPGNWYHPIRDWWSRTGGGKPYTPGYDWQGNLVTPDDPDAENRRIIHRVRERMHTALPSLIEGFNIQAWNAFKPDVPEVVEANTFPQSYAEFVPGNVILDEKHYHARPDGTPTMHATWTKTRKVLRLGNELLQRFGAYHYTGGVPNSGAGPFLLHAHSLSYAVGARTFGGGNSYGKYPPEYEAFLTFSQRFARYLFHPSRMRFVPGGDDETGDRAIVRCAGTVVYRDLCYYLATDRTFSVLVHLWNQPVEEAMNVNKCEAPSMVTDAVVTLRQPPCMIPEKGKVYVLSPEWPDWCVSVTPDRAGDHLSVPVPAFRYWAMVVLQHPMIPSGIDQPAHHWFLPVPE